MNTKPAQKPALSQPARYVVYALVSLIAALVCALGHAFSETGYFASQPWLVALETAGMTLLFCGALVAIDHFARAEARTQLPDQGKHAARSSRHTGPTWRVKSVALYTVIMLICWAPYLVAFYPASFGFDTLSQITQFYPGHGRVWQSGVWFDVQFLDNNPVFDSLLFGAIGYMGDALFGSWNPTLFAFVIVQAIAQATGFTLLCAYFQKRSMNWQFVLASFLFFCLFPVFPINATTVIKDTLFSWLFTFYFIATAHIVATRGKALASAKYAALFAILSLLLALTKKTGIYVVGAETLVLLVCYWRQWRALLLSLGVVVATMYLVLPMGLFPLLNVGAGGSQESLGLLFQQTSRYVIDHPDEVTAEEKAAIDAVIEYDRIPELYDPKINDDIKYTYRVDTATSEDVKNYIQVWAAHTLRHPDSTFKAVLGTLAPYFDPLVPINLYMEVPTVHVGGTVEGGDELVSHARATVPEATAGLREAFRNAYATISHAPVIGLLFSNALYGVVIPCLALALLIAARRMWANMPLVALVVLLVGSYLIAPVAWSRYLFPLIYCAPAILGLAILEIKNACLAKQAE